MLDQGVGQEKIKKIDRRTGLFDMFFQAWVFDVNL